MVADLGIFFKVVINILNYIKFNKPIIWKFVTIASWVVKENKIVATTKLKGVQLSSQSKRTYNYNIFLGTIF